ncbi:protein-lysine methyltransferase METTL21D-like isoform X2 [Acanthaster planci]|uniref:Protein-lysine methyltransferase METTL21D-like isoform X2 n=1 Tax=Acanthaster planci TaxID=133434 RepID=A0A8B7ZJX3_ACAPL|nr:protein-lysine methyltransferase METTL21D-like isoform X2 [Acanthaster planci]
MDDQPKYFDRILEFDGQDLTIKQCYFGDVGCVVWDAALVLLKFLELDFFKPKRDSLEKKHVIELGAGTGAVGLAASLLGADVTVTDLEDFIPLMQLNIDTNKSVIRGTITAKTLQWGASVANFLPHPDVILMSDCVYYLEAVDDLVKTMNELSGPETVILCSYEERTMGQNLQSLDRFLKLVHEIFSVEEVPLDQQDPVYRSEDIHILTMKRTAPDSRQNSHVDK